MTCLKPSCGLELRAIRKRLGKTDVLNDISFTVAKGEFLVIVGPSGCGKTTLLRLIAGLEVPDSGTVYIGGRLANHVPPGQRDVAMVFQNHALYPHMTVRQNIAFGLKSKGVSKPAIILRTEEVARTLEIFHLLDRKAWSLSGGQRQRVAIGRAMVKRPQLFMFDEPLSNLDASLRVKLRQEIRRLHDQVGATSVLVTHDQAEAMAIADKILVLNSSQMEQIGSPHEIYNRPASRFVAEFVGVPQMNILNIDVVRDSTHWLGPLDASQLANTSHIGFRPEDISLLSIDLADMPAKVESLEYIGDCFHVYLSLKNGAKVCALSRSKIAPQQGDIVGIYFERNAGIFFNSDGLAI